MSQKYHSKMCNEAAAVDTEVRYTEAATIAPHVRKAYADTSGGAFTLTLPRCADVKPGTKIDIVLLANTGTACTVAANANDGGYSSAQLDTNDDRVTMQEANGIWEEAYSEVTP